MTIIKLQETDVQVGTLGSSKAWLPIFGGGKGGSAERGAWRQPKVRFKAKFKTNKCITMLFAA
jgi:hypothetical protein